MFESHILEKPYTDEEIAKFSDAFKGMKTFNNGTIHQSELHSFNTSVGVPTTQAQADVYNVFWRWTRGDDRVPLDGLMGIFRTLHDPKAFSLVVANAFDKNKDGLISQEEFELGFKCLVAYDPETFGEMGRTNYEKFLQEADTNKDGKVQIEEFAAWLDKH